MNARGTTLVEMAAGIAIAGVLMAAACGLLLSGSRLAQSESAARGVRQNLHTAAAVLRTELAALGPDDLLTVTDSSVRMRAYRGMGVLCAPPSGARVVLDTALLSLLRAVDPSRDSAWLFVEGDLGDDTTDDAWLTGAVTATGVGICANGTRGLALTLAGEAAARLAEVTQGAPLRLFEVQEYRVYRDADGFRMLGVRGPSPPGWSATSPVAGPLVPGNGLALVALDSSGGVTADVALARAIGVALRLRAADPLPTGRRPADSLLLRVGVGSP